MNTVVYIAGKMSGLPDYGRAKFAEADAYLQGLGGYTVLNPAVLPSGMPKVSYLPICMAMIDAADIVYALNNSDTSMGASVEIAYAKYQGKPIWYEAREEEL